MLLHIDIFVKSIEESVKFYVQGLGYTVVDDFWVEGELVRFVSNNLYDRYRILLLKIQYGSAMIELVQYPSGIGTNDLIRNKSTISIYVPSLDKKIYELAQKGIYPCSDVFYVNSPRLGTSRIVFFTDPDGNSIEFLEKVVL